MSHTYLPVDGVATELPKMSSPMKDASADDLRVLYVLAMSGYSLTVEGIKEALGCSLTRAAAGVEYWIEAGVLQDSGNSCPQTEAQDATRTPHLVTDTLPMGNAAEVAREISEAELKDFLEACSAILGKFLNTGEIQLLAALQKQLCVEPIYLINLLAECVKKGKGSVKYLEKTACDLCNRGIHTPLALEEYLKEQELIRSVEGIIKRLYGMGSRAFTPKEEEILGRWVNTYGYGMDILGIAYDITAEYAQKPTLKYADKMITEWYHAGLRTVEAVDAYLKDKASKKTKPVPKKGKKAMACEDTFDIDAVFQAALDRSYHKPEEG